VTYISLDLLFLWKSAARYYSSNYQGFSLEPLSNYTREDNHSTLQSSSAINISETIPVGPAALPLFIILRAFKISSLLISSQGPSTFSQLVALSYVFSSFSSFSIYVLHSSFTWSLSTSIVQLASLIQLHPAWILPFALQPCRHYVLKQLYLHFILQLFILIPIICSSGFMLYLIACTVICFYTISVCLSVCHVAILCLPVNTGTYS